MAVVGLMSVIIIGLMAMFNQTQRAFRLGMTQTDVLEAGRMATDMLVRELEQMRPTYGAVDFTFRTNSPNFYTKLREWDWQSLPGGTANRSNIMTDLFFLKRENQTWTGIGYYVTNTEVLSSGAVGSLYRYETNQIVYQGLNPSWMFAGFNNYRSSASNGISVSKVLDGVVHFRVRAFNTTNAWITTRLLRNNTNSIFTFQSALSQGIPDVDQYIFCSNAVPAFVELELGVLEPQIYERYKSLPTPQVRANYLRDQVAHVHVFRQRIPIRNVDPAAYP